MFSRKEVSLYYITFSNILENAGNIELVCNFQFVIYFQI